MDRVLSPLGEGGKGGPVLYQNERKSPISLLRREQIHEEFYRCKDLFEEKGHYSQEKRTARSSEESRVEQRVREGRGDFPE